MEVKGLCNGLLKELVEVHRHQIALDSNLSFYIGGSFAANMFPTFAIGLVTAG